MLKADNIGGVFSEFTARPALSVGLMKYYVELVKGSEHGEGLVGASDSSQVCVAHRDQLLYSPVGDSVRLTPLERGGGAGIGECEIW